MPIRSFEQSTPLIHSTAYVDETAVIIGDVEIDDDVSIWPGVVIRGDVNKIRIGARSNVQDGSVLHVTHQSKHNPAGAPLILHSARPMRTCAGNTQR